MLIELLRMGESLLGKLKMVTWRAFKYYTGLPEKPPNQHMVVQNTPRM